MNSAGHHAERGNVAHRHLAHRGRDCAERVVCLAVGEEQELVHGFLGERHGGESVRGELSCRTVDIRGPERVGERGLDARPENLARVVEQFLARMRGECAGVFRHAQFLDSGRTGRRLRLHDEAGTGDHDGWDAEHLGGDAGAGLLWRAESAPAVAGDDGVDLHLFQLALELVLFVPDHARARIGPGRANLIQKNHAGLWELGEDEPFELWMGHGGHETAAHERKGLAVERGESRPLPNGRDGTGRYCGQVGSVSAGQFAHAVLAYGGSNHRQQE